MTSYSVNVRRRGIPALEVRLLVRAESKTAAGALAAALAEQRHGGMFEPRSIRRARASAEAVFEAA
jgi:hypothetical protein